MMKLFATVLACALISVSSAQRCLDPNATLSTFTAPDVSSPVCPDGNPDTWMECMPDCVTAWQTIAADLGCCAVDFVEQTYYNETTDALEAPTAWVNIITQCSLQADVENFFGCPTDECDLTALNYRLNIEDTFPPMAGVGEPPATTYCPEEAPSMWVDCFDARCEFGLQAVLQDIECCVVDFLQLLGPGHTQADAEAGFVNVVNQCGLVVELMGTECDDLNCATSLSNLGRDIIDVSLCPSDTPDTWTTCDQACADSFDANVRIADCCAVEAMNQQFFSGADTATAGQALVNAIDVCSIDDAFLLPDNSTAFQAIAERGCCPYQNAVFNSSTVDLSSCPSGSPDTWTDCSEECSNAWDVVRDNLACCTSFFIEMEYGVTPDLGVDGYLNVNTVCVEHREPLQGETCPITTCDSMVVDFVDEREFDFVLCPQVEDPLEFTECGVICAGYLQDTINEFGTDCFCGLNVLQLMNFVVITETENFYRSWDETYPLWIPNVARVCAPDGLNISTIAPECLDSCFAAAIPVVNAGDFSECPTGLPWTWTDCGETSSCAEAMQTAFNSLDCCLPHLLSLEFNRGVLDENQFGQGMGNVVEMCGLDVPETANGDGCPADLCDVEVNSQMVDVSSCDMVNMPGEWTTCTPECAAALQTVVDDVECCAVDFLETFVGVPNQNYAELAFPNVVNVCGLNIENLLTTGCVSQCDLDAAAYAVPPEFTSGSCPMGLPGQWTDCGDMACQTAMQTAVNDLECCTLNLLGREFPGDAPNIEYAEMAFPNVVNVCQLDVEPLVTAGCVDECDLAVSTFTVPPEFTSGNCPTGLPGEWTDCGDMACVSAMQATAESLQCCTVNLLGNVFPDPAPDIEYAEMAFPNVVERCNIDTTGFEGCAVDACDAEVVMLNQGANPPDVSSCPMDLMPGQWTSCDPACSAGLQSALDNLGCCAVDFLETFVGLNRQEYAEGAFANVVEQCSLDTSALLDRDICPCSVRAALYTVPAAFESSCPDGLPGMWTDCGNTECETAMRTVVSDLDCCAVELLGNVFPGDAPNLEYAQRAFPNVVQQCNIDTTDLKGCAVDMCDAEVVRLNQGLIQAAPTPPDVSSCPTDVMPGNWTECDEACSTGLQSAVDTLGCCAVDFLETFVGLNAQDYAEEAFANVMEQCGLDISRAMDRNECSCTSRVTFYPVPAAFDSSCPDALPGMWENCGNTECQTAMQTVVADLDCCAVNLLGNVFPDPAPNFDYAREAFPNVVAQCDIETSDLEGCAVDYCDGRVVGFTLNTEPDVSSCPTDVMPGFWTECDDACSAGLQSAVDNLGCCAVDFLETFVGLNKQEYADGAFSNVVTQCNLDLSSVNFTDINIEEEQCSCAGRAAFYPVPAAFRDGSSCPENLPGMWTNCGNEACTTAVETVVNDLSCCAVNLIGNVFPDDAPNLGYAETAFPNLLAQCEIPLDDFDGCAVDACDVEVLMLNQGASAPDVSSCPTDVMPGNWVECDQACSDGLQSAMDTLDCCIVDFLETFVGLNKQEYALGAFSNVVNVCSLDTSGLAGTCLCDSQINGFMRPAGFDTCPEGLPGTWNDCGDMACRTAMQEVAAEYECCAVNILGNTFPAEPNLPYAQMAFPNVVELCEIPTATFEGCAVDSCDAEVVMLNQGADAPDVSSCDMTNMPGQWTECDDACSGALQSAVNLLGCCSADFLETFVGLNKQEYAEGALPNVVSVCGLDVSSLDSCDSECTNMLSEFEDPIDRETTTCITDGLPGDWTECDEACAAQIQTVVNGLGCCTVDYLLGYGGVTDRMYANMAFNSVMELCGIDISNVEGSCVEATADEVEGASTISMSLTLFAILAAAAVVFQN